MGAIGTISRCFIGLVLLLNRLAGAWKVTHPNTVALRSNTRRYAGVLRGHGDGHTVYGLCSAIPDGGCGVAITRISGQQSHKVLEILTTKQVRNRRIMEACICYAGWKCKRRDVQMHSENRNAAKHIYPCSGDAYRQGNHHIFPSTQFIHGFVAQTGKNQPHEQARML